MIRSKKIFAVVLAICIVASMSITALAASYLEDFTGSTSAEKSGNIKTAQVTSYAGKTCYLWTKSGTESDLTNYGSGVCSWTWASSSSKTIYGSVVGTGGGSIQWTTA